MNRNAKRAEQQEVNKNKKWYYGLPPSKKAFIGWMIEQGVIKNDNTTSDILDDCFIAAMVEKLELKQSKELVKTANKYIEEMKNILESYKGDYLEMLKDEKLRREIREKALNLLKDGQVMSRGVNDFLKKEYPKVSVRDLTIIWAEAKEDSKQEMTPKSTDAEKEKFLNETGIEQQEILNKEVAADKEDIKEHNEKVLREIYSDAKELFVKNEDSVKLKSTLTNEGEHGLEIIDKTTKSKLEFKESGNVLLTVENKPTLKIKSIEVEGRFGTYFKGTEGVKAGDKVYKDITEVEEEKNDYLRRAEDKEKEIKHTIEKLNRELQERVDNKLKAFAKYSEIEEVFKM